MGEAAKLAHLLESASLQKSIWLKIMKKYLLNIFPTLSDGWRLHWKLLQQLII